MLYITRPYNKDDSLSIIYYNIFYLYICKCFIITHSVVLVFLYIFIYGIHLITMCFNFHVDSKLYKAYFFLYRNLNIKYFKCFDLQ